VEGRAAWLMLVVVCCCCQLLYRIVDKTTYVEVFGRLCVCTLVQKEERGKCRPSPTRKCCVGINFVSAQQGHVNQKKAPHCYTLARPASRPSLMPLPLVAPPTLVDPEVLV